MAHLFQHLIRKANHKPGFWQGHKVERGQLITGWIQLSKQTGISRQSIRTCLNRLKSTREITLEPTHQFTKITILNYEQFQSMEDEANPQANPSINLQSTHHQPTINPKQEYNNTRTQETLYNTLQPSAGSDDADAFVNSLSSSKPEPKVRKIPVNKPRQKNDVIFPPLLDTPEAHASWKKFKAHRRGMAAPISLQQSQSILDAWASRDPAVFCSAIEKAVSAGWKKLVFPEDMNREPNGFKPQQPTGRPFPKKFELAENSGRQIPVEDMPLSDDARRFLEKCKAKGVN